MINNGCFYYYIISIDLNFANVFHSQDDTWDEEIQIRVGGHRVMDSTYNNQYIPYNNQYIPTIITEVMVKVFGA